MSGVAKHLKSGAWTQEEDQLLARWQAEYGNRWAEVAKHIPGKTGQQCAQRWRHRVNPNISREKWTEEEDRRLEALVKEHGHSWAEIARHLPGRTDQQCMGRWRRHVDPSLRKDDWEQDEDELLADLVQEYGSSWSEISKYMGGRSAHQCRLRWCQLSGAEQSSKGTRSAAKSTSKAASRSASKSSGAGAGGSSVAQLAKRLDYADAASLRRQSTARAVAGGAGAAWEQDEGQGMPAFLSPAAAQRLRCRSARAARRLSSVSEVGMTEEPSEEDSPAFTLRKTTARTAGRAAVSAGTAGTADELLPQAGSAGATKAAGAGPCSSRAGAGAVDPLRAAGEPLVAEAEGSVGRVGQDPPEQLGTSSGGRDAMDICSERAPSHQQLQQVARLQGREVAAVEPAASLRLPAAASPPQACLSGAGSDVGPAAMEATACGGEASAAGQAAVSPMPVLGGTGTTAAAAGAAAQPQPTLDPKRPRGRSHVFVRPLELPPSEADPKQDTPAAAPQEQEESPALTQALGPSLDLLSPSRTLSHAALPAQPTHFSPPSSVRKRVLPPSRMAASGPRLPPLAAPEEGAAPASQPEAPSRGDVTPVRTKAICPRGGTEEFGGEHGWGLTPNVLTLLQSPQPAPCDGMDPLISPEFGGLLTPEWAKRDRSHPPPTDGWSGGRSSGRRAAEAGQPLCLGASLDFALFGSSPKKAKTDGGASPLPLLAPSTCLTASASWLSTAPAAATAAAAGPSARAAMAAHLLMPDSVGRSALAAAMQQGLGLDSTAKTGPATGSWLGGTLTSMKGPVRGEAAGRGQPPEEGVPLTSANVRVQLRTLLGST